MQKVVGAAACNIRPFFKAILNLSLHSKWVDAKYAFFGVLKVVFFV